MFLDNGSSQLENLTSFFIPVILLVIAFKRILISLYRLVFYLKSLLFVFFHFANVILFPVYPNPAGDQACYNIARRVFVL